MQIKCFDSQGLWMIRCDCGKDILVKIDYKKRKAELVEG